MCQFTFAAGEVYRDHHNVMIWDDHEICDDFNPGYSAEDALKAYGDIDPKEVIAMK